MSVPTVPDPDLRACTAALLRTGADFVVIGGFAVIANDYVRATEDVDLLIPDDPDNDERLVDALSALGATVHDSGRPPQTSALRGREHIRLMSPAGLLDLLREGVAPLDFATVSVGALTADLGDGPFRVAGLESIVAFKRLADRPRDRLDLLELEERHGPLPIVPIPGLEDR